MEPTPRAQPPHVDFERASLAELRSLRGIGARRAVDLARARWDCAPERLAPESVHGIGPKTAERLRGGQAETFAQASLGE